MQLGQSRNFTRDPKFIKLAQSFPEIMSHDFRAETVKHGVVHGIDTGKAAPCRTAPRPLGSGPKATLGKEAWMDLLEKGIIERCQSNWSSGLHLQPKPDGRFVECQSPKVKSTTVKFLKFSFHTFKNPVVKYPYL